MPEKKHSRRSNPKFSHDESKGTLVQLDNNLCQPSELGTREDPTSCRLDLINALVRAAEFAPANYSYVHRDLITFLQGRLPKQTPDCIMETLGISANTWTKLKKGQPVRTSVAERLVERVARYEVAARGPT